MATLSEQLSSTAASLHLPKGIAQRRTLARTEKLDIGFDVESAGLIIVVAASGSWDEVGQVLPRPREGEHVPHRIELIAPDGTADSVSTSQTGESHIVCEVPQSVVTPGRWTARLTNLGTTPREFGLHVSYPSTRELQTADLSADVFAELAALQLEFRRGHQASRLELATSAGPITHYFTVDEIEYSCPWMPRVLGYLTDLKSTSASLSVPGGTADPLLRYELDFADEGVEVGGTIPLDLRNMRLKVDLPIIVRYFKAAQSRTLSCIDYEEADVSAQFSFEPQFAELVEWFPGFFPRWRRLIQRRVETACRELLAASELRQVFSDVIQAEVLEQIGENATPVGVAAADGKLRISYYTV